jgi:hypothetical protein
VLSVLYSRARVILTPWLCAALLSVLYNRANNNTLACDAVLSVLHSIVARLILTPGLCASVLSVLYSRARVILTPGHLFFELKGSLSTTPSYTERDGKQ